MTVVIIWVFDMHVSTICHNIKNKFTTVIHCIRDKEKKLMNITLQVFNLLCCISTFLVLYKRYNCKLQTSSQMNNPKQLTQVLLTSSRAQVLMKNRRLQQYNLMPPIDMTYF